MILDNEIIRVELDPRFPVPLAVGRRNLAWRTHEKPFDRFPLVLNGQTYEPTVASVGPGRYVLEVAELALTMTFTATLEENDLVLRLDSVEEKSDFRLQKWSAPMWEVIAGQGKYGDSYLRHIARHRNWSQHWTPGTTIYDGWEDFGLMSDAYSEPGPQWTNHACLWSPRLCFAVCSSVHVRPLVTSLSGNERTGQRFAIVPGPHSYRLRGTLAEPFEFRLGILGDYNGDGKVDWADAAAWEGDHKLKPNPLYRDALVYKLMMDLPTLPKPLRTYADALEEIKLAHKLSGGRRQFVYLVGWQHAGHDTGFPCHTVLNPRLGTADDFRKLIEDAKAYNATVSIHGNYDDSYEIFPEYQADLLSRTDKHRHVWFHNTLFDEDVYSISHTLAQESGYDEDRTKRLLDLLPLRDTIHLDAHRCFNEIVEQGIDAECEVQRGMVAVKAMFARHGLDVTIEGGDDEVNGLYSWVCILPDWNHRYRTVMHHGRTFGMWRANLPSGRDNLHPSLEGDGLGQFFFRIEDLDNTPESMEAHLYLHWMTAKLLERKKMTGLWIGDWNHGVRAEYADCTYSTAGVYGRPLEAWYEGVPIARGTDRFLPWSPNEIIAYSLEGGPQAWNLPKGWDSFHVSASRLGEPVEPPQVEVDDQYVGWLAPPRTVIKLTR